MTTPSKKWIARAVEAEGDADIAAGGVLDTLDCPNCGESVFVADHDGLFSDGDDGICDGCGLKCRVTVDDETADITHDDEVADRGQPRCTGACGAIEEFVGTPCYWDCLHTRSAN